MVGNKELTNYIRSIQKNMNCSSENKKKIPGRTGIRYTRRYPEESGYVI